MLDRTLRIERLAVEHYGLLERFYRQQRSHMRIKDAQQVWIARAPELCAGLCLHSLAQGFWLTGLLVDAHKRGRGIASQLIQHSLAGSTRPTWLFCAPELCSFYQPLGFLPCSDLPQPLAQRLIRYHSNKPELIALVRSAPSI